MRSSRDRHHGRQGVLQFRRCPPRPPLWFPAQQPQHDPSQRPWGLAGRRQDHSARRPPWNPPGRHRRDLLPGSQRHQEATQPRSVPPPPCRLRPGSPMHQGRAVQGTSPVPGVPSAAGSVRGQGSVQEPGSVRAPGGVGAPDVLRAPSGRRLAVPGPVVPKHQGRGAVRRIGCRLQPSGYRSARLLPPEREANQSRGRDRRTPSRTRSVRGPGVHARSPRRCHRSLPQTRDWDSAR
jgi:hypothetical protein